MQPLANASFLCLQAVSEHTSHQRVVARADALAENCDHKKTFFFIEDGIERATVTTGTLERIRLFFESLPIMCFLQ